MQLNCPKCNADNKVDVTFDFEQLACSKCQLFSNSSHVFKIRINKSNVVLSLNQKGKLFGINYCVTGIVVKKHGATITWREYHLRGEANEIAFLSEFEGHWIFLKPCEEKVKYTGKVAVYKGDTYRWYEDTPCHIIHAEGFFEKSLPLTTHRMYEYILKNSILSSDDWQDCIGEHIPKKVIKNAFGLSKMPTRSGIGLVQPYYFSIKGSAILLSIFLVAFVVIHIMVVASRTNQTVLDKQIDTFDNAFEEFQSNSFSLKGGVAPLTVEAQADVNNNWVNVELALVNERTNEVLIANKDIEYYSGYEGGESWTEGSKNATFNFCSIAQGTYHLVVQTDNGFKIPDIQYNDSSVLIEQDVQAFLEPDGKIRIEDARFENKVITTFENNEEFGSYYLSKAKEFFHRKDKEMAQIEIIKSNLRPTGNSNLVTLKVIWKPNNFWNLVVCSIILIALFALVFWGRYLFERKKWSNSLNSPYSA